MPSALQQAIVVLAVIAGGCAAEPSVPPSVSLTEGAGLAPEDDIDGLDVAADASGGVHALWLERTHVFGGFGGRERLVYRTGSGTPLRWGPRTVVAEGAIGGHTPQIVVAPDGVHALAGPRLHHWWRPLAGAGFQDAGELLAPEDPPAGGFKASATREGFLIVFMPPELRKQPIYSVRWRASGRQPPVAVATAESFARAQPAILAGPARWMAFWPHNALVEYRDAQLDGMTAMRAQADVRTARLDESGRWGPATRVTPALPSAVTAIAAAGGIDAPTVFFAIDGLFVSRLANGAWTSPVRVAAYAPGALSGSAETSAIATVQCNGHAVLAWVDARNRRSDRRWWNPLGGFPWGDNPDWINNDLFVATQVPRDAPEAKGLVPRRLTPPDSMTRDIAIVARDNRLLVLRTGRARVRKAPNDAGAPPEVVQTIVPCN